MMVNHAYGTMTERTAEVTFQGHKCIVVHHYELNGDDGNAYVGFDTMRCFMKDFKTHECLDSLVQMAKELDKWEKQNIAKDDSMKLGLRIGERGTVNDFAAIYDLDYLDAMGLYLYRYDDPNFMKVNTKKGNISLNMNKQYVLTYCGNKVWDARKEVHPQNGTEGDCNEL